MSFILKNKFDGTFYKDNIQVITPFINDFKTAIETLINK